MRCAVTARPGSSLARACPQRHKQKPSASILPRIEFLLQQYTEYSGVRSYEELGAQKVRNHRAPVISIRMMVSFYVHL